MNSWIAVFLIAAIAIQLYASSVVLRFPNNSLSVRIYQLALIWLLPVLGASICLAVARSDGKSVATPETFGDHGYDGGNDFGGSSGGGDGGGD